MHRKPVDSNAVESALGNFCNKNNEFLKFNYDTEVIEQLGLEQNKLNKLKNMLYYGRDKGGWLKYIENIGGIGVYKNNKNNIYYTDNFFDYYYKNNTWLSPEINIIKLFLDDILYHQNFSYLYTYPRKTQGLVHGDNDMKKIYNVYKIHAETTKTPAYDFDNNFIQNYKFLKKNKNN